MSKKFFLNIFAISFSFFLMVSSTSAEVTEWPTFLYCDTVNNQLGSAITPPLPIQNNLRYSGRYFDVDLQEPVDFNFGRFFQDDPMTLGGGSSGPDAQDVHSFTGDPMNLQSKILNSAHSTKGAAYANTGGAALKWFILHGASEPVSLRGDFAFQGWLYGAYDETRMEARAHFSHGVNVVRYPTIATLYRPVVFGGGCVMPGETCGGGSLAGTIPDACFISDGTDHLINYVVRSNPFVILPDIPFSVQIWVNANAAAWVPEDLTGEATAYSDWMDPGLATSYQFGLAELTPEGFTMDTDGDPATHDEVPFSVCGYKLRTTADASTRFQTTESARTKIELNEDLTSTIASLDGTVTGRLAGTFTMSDFQLVTIESGDYLGKGFFKGHFSATLESIVYAGDWKGMAFFSEDDRRIYLKGRLTGTIGGVTDGYLSESTPGSGVYDRLFCTLSVGDLSNEDASAILDLTGHLNYTSQTPYPSSSLELIQSTSSGEMSGENTGQIDLRVSQMRVTRFDCPFFGEGYSVLSFSTPFGTGQGFTYDKTPFTDVHYQRGMVTGPITGTISFVLDEDRATHYLAGTIRRVDLGLPPVADLNVSSWTSPFISPGDRAYYTIKYSNSGTDTAENVRVIMRLAPGLEFISCTSEGIFNPESNEVVFHVGNLLPKRAKYAYVLVKAKWALPWFFSFINEVYIGSDSQEKDTILDPENAVLTPEWNEFQYAHGNDYDVRDTPPNYDPNDPVWQNHKPTSFRDRTLMAIELIKQYNPEWGSYIEQLYNEGKIHHDPDLDSSAWANWIGSRHLYIGYDDMKSNWNDISWNANMYAQCWLAILATKILHEAQHSKQKKAASENGEIGAFITENIMLMQYLYDLVNSGKYDQARELADYIKTMRWTDLKQRNKKWTKAIELSEEMIEQIDAIIKNLNPFQLDPSTAKFTITATITNLNRKGSQLPPDKIQNLSEFITLPEIACDPNAIYGPTGCVSPGQRLDYRIEFENVGKGKAFGVYFTNTLPDGLDDSTLEIGPVFDIQTGTPIAPAGTYDPATRTITWTVGEVGPGKGGEAEFHVNVKGDAPNGTEIIEYATIYFPSVPQTLNTEAAVAVVCLTPPAKEPPRSRPGGPYLGSIGATMTLDARGSYDLDGTIVQYDWDWDGDGTYDQSTANPVIDHKWNEPISGIVTLRVTDNDGLTDEATADLLIRDNRIFVYVDISPGRCPNRINLNNKRVLWVAIPGTDSFDATTIDPSTIRLTRPHVDCSVPPIRWKYVDAATPFDNVTLMPCACHALKGDGRSDLVLKFDAKALIRFLQLDTLPKNTILPLVLNGNLKAAAGGNPITGQDCVKIICK